MFAEAYMISFLSVPSGLGIRRATHDCNHSANSSPEFVDVVDTSKINQVRSVQLRNTFASGQVGDRL